MPATPDELIDLLSLEQIEIGLFRGRHPNTTWQRTFGGQVLAQALVAAQLTVDGPRTCHSFNAYFLRPGHNDSPIIYDVERLRDGHSFSSRRVSARQQGQVIFTLTASFQVAEEGLSHSDPMPVNVPDPQSCPPLQEVFAQDFGEPTELWHEWDALDVRYAGQEGTSHLGGVEPVASLWCWVRTTGPIPDSPALSQAVAAYLSDMTLLSVAAMPHRLTFGSPHIQAASINHTMWFERPLRADRWLLYKQDSPSAHGALGLSTGKLFQDGVLVACCAQEGLIRVTG